MTGGERQMAQQLQHIEFEDFADNLDRVFDQVRERNQPILVERNGQTYRLEKETPQDIWKDYDPRRVQKAIAATSGMFKGMDIDALIADLEAQREQGPDRFQ